MEFRKMIIRRWSFFCGFVAIFSLFGGFLIAGERLDRKKIVDRHAIHSDSPSMTVPLANGEFCFNVDGTGFQTFAGSTLDHRGWFSVPLPDGYSLADVPSSGTFQTGRNSGPDLFPSEKEPLREWMFDNPHRMNLARVRLSRGDGTPVPIESISSLHHSLDLWTGIHRSSFSVDGIPFTVETAVGDSDTVAFSVDSTGIGTGDFVIVLDFPYPTSAEGDWVGDFENEESHRTEMVATDRRGWTLARRFGDFASGDYDYSVRIDRAEGDGIIERTGPNRFTIRSRGERFSFALSFGNFAPTGKRPGTGEEKERHFREFDPLSPLSEKPLYEAISEESASRWEDYWLSGGAIDLSGSSDPRWRELERRIVLSQYLEKMSASGSYPPSEAGLLTIDNWRGQFHMEMVWWHLAHWFLWGREREAEKPLACYERFKEPASELARQLGYHGYQWQKSIGPEGRTAPWMGNHVLLWKEPHPIFFAELEYRAHPNRQTLEKWADLINGTAEFMADYVTRDENGIYHLDPVMPPSELGIIRDSTYDLCYWKLGLMWANRWRVRMGEEPVDEWTEIAGNLAPLPIGEDGLYLRCADWPVWKTWEHPDLIGAFGQFPPLDSVDPLVAERTIEGVIRRWEWNRCWGWDFPWAAMAAARTGHPDWAIDLLLSDADRNHYDERGVNQGGPCPYLPGNAGLLYAVAMMLAGWDETMDGEAPLPEKDAIHETAPGFPSDGSWRVRWENLRPAP